MGGIIKKFSQWYENYHKSNTKAIEIKGTYYLRIRKDLISQHGCNNYVKWANAYNNERIFINMGSY